MPGSLYAQMPVLVTGGQGFIGSWLVERLLDEGAHVVVPCRGSLASSRFRTKGIFRRCTVVQGGILDHDFLDGILREYGIRVVFHLAAQPIVGIANLSPHGTLEVNIRGTYSLLDACRRHSDQIDRIVVASSDHAYGAHDVMPYREDFALRGIFPYDVSKACTDVIARSFAAAFSLPIAVTRLANVYGGGDPNWSRIVPDTVRALIEDRRPVIRSDGTPERDYLYVEDAVDAYLTIGLALDDKRHWGSAWNAGHGQAVPVEEIVRRIIAVSGKDVEPDIRGGSQKEIDRQFLDATKIRKQLGWVPKWDLDSGLKRTYAWYERNLSKMPAVAAAVAH
jgi:CDP-glucose 4,6-dehydratase